MKLDVLPLALILQIFEVCSHDYCFKVVDIVLFWSALTSKYFHQGHEKDTLPLSIHSLVGGIDEMKYMKAELPRNWIWLLPYCSGCCLCFPLTLQRKQARISKKKRIAKAKEEAFEYHKLLATSFFIAVSKLICDFIFQVRNFLERYVI
ncbi:hypothetical protein CsSME_00053143 [Camellia sinensis var. sinensis]